MSRGRVIRCVVYCWPLSERTDVQLSLERSIGIGERKLSEEAKFGELRL